MNKTASEVIALSESMSTSIGEYVQQLAQQGKEEGRLVMHDNEGKPIAALVLITGDVAKRLSYLDRFKATTERYFASPSLH